MNYSRFVQPHNLGAWTCTYVGPFFDLLATPYRSARANTNQKEDTFIFHSCCCLVVRNLFFPYILGMSSSQLTNSIIFQRVGQPPTCVEYMTPFFWLLRSVIFSPRDLQGKFFPRETTGFPHLCKHLPVWVIHCLWCIINLYYIYIYI